MDLNTVILVLLLAPLVACLIAGILGNQIGRVAAHRITIIGVFISFVLSLYVAKLIFLDHIGKQNLILYTWAQSGSFSFQVGFLIDSLSSVMLLVVTFVSFLVHVYSIGYMADDPGYQRFFSYISLFTFAMLALVLADNFMVLFFGWEGVGLVSYLLIGFWFKKESANQGSLKAFVANRVGDFGFILGIGALLTYCGAIDYATVFASAPKLLAQGSTITIIPHVQWSIITVVCLLLFVGAMGKSAQIPLHIWLPESMEGPTPISALIHAATMVTAGVYMVARMSPLFELSATALSVLLIIGATGALFLGILGIVQNDIKRVVAYSTLSQLGYMIAGEGASAFSASIFHLATHACFKALLFLAAGSVIIAMHHEQDMRKMGNLRRYMPITYITFLIGSLSLCAIPPFAGFYSKDAIIEAVGASTIFGSRYAYCCVLIGSFVTALYTFRAFFMTFHGKERMDEETKHHLHETPWVVWLPLVILAIPSIALGGVLIFPMLYKLPTIFSDAISVAPQFNVLAEMGKEYHGAWRAVGHADQTLPFWFAITGIVVAWLSYLKFPKLPAFFQHRFGYTYQILINKYGFDLFNQIVIIRGTQFISNILYKLSDVLLIDGLMVHGTGNNITRMARFIKRFQSGYLFHYAFVMIISLVVFLIWVILAK